MIERILQYLIVSIIFLACGCTPVSRINIRLDADFSWLSQRLGTYLEEEEYRLVSEDEYADYRLRIERVNWFQPCVLSSNSLLIQKELYVPLLKFPDYRENLLLDDIVSGTQYPLYKLSEDNKSPGLPDGWLAAPVNGKYVSQPGYPLQKNDYLVVEGKRDENFSRLYSLLAGWITVPEETEKDVWIGAVGDLMLQRGVENTFFASPGGLETIFNDTLPELRRLDILCGNLEGAVTTKGEKVSKSYNFRFQPAVLEYLKKAGFDYLSLTNNHSFDFGEEGFLASMGHLSSSGIFTSGVGRNLEEARKPALIHSGAESVAIYSFGAYPRENSGFDGRLETGATTEKPGVLWAEESNLSVIAENLNPDNINVALVHGGYEWVSYPGKEQKKLYHRLIDSGFSVVFAAHPHVLQGMELYGNGIIFYSLGNFIFPGMEEMPLAQESLIASVGFFKGQPFYLRLVPVELRSRQVFLASSDAILKRFLSLTIQ